MPVRRVAQHMSALQGVIRSGEIYGAAWVYVVCLTALAAAVLLRWLVDPVLGDALPLVTLFGAVAAAVWLGGYRPAVLVALLGYIACAYFFMPPRGTLGLDNSANLVG